MLSKLPIDLKKVNRKDLDNEILRAAMIAELDAVSLYEQLAAMTRSIDIKKVLMDVAEEEKEHVGEFLTLLKRHDKEQEEELKEGEEEVKEILEGKD
jgi:rubrerythrin